MADATDSQAGAEAAEAEPEAEAPEVDEHREAVLATFAESLGDDLVGSHIAPGRNLWLRVTRDAWFAAAEAAKQRLSFHFFDFLSAIDWMPSRFPPTIPPTPVAFSTSPTARFSSSPSAICSWCRGPQSRS